MDIVAQKQQVEFLFTSQLSEADKSIISELMEDFSKKYLFRAKSVYSDESSKPVSNVTDIESKVKHKANKVFLSAESLVKGNLNITGCVSLIDDYERTGQYRLVTSDKASVRGLKKYIKRLIKETPEGENTRILWFNGFIPYFISCEMLHSIESSTSNGEMTKVKLNYKEEHYFRPVGVAYKIEFDSVGFFDAYRLVIREASGVEIFNEVMKVEPHTAYDADEAYCISSPESNRKCVFYIDQEPLFERCVQEFDDLDKINGGCSECGHKCLYLHTFSISIRGVVINGDCSARDATVLSPVYFQCAKGY